MSETVNSVTSVDTTRSNRKKKIYVDVRDVFEEEFEDSDMSHASATSSPVKPFASPVSFANALTLSGGVTFNYTTDSEDELGIGDGWQNRHVMSPQNSRLRMRISSPIRPRSDSLLSFAADKTDEDSAIETEVESSASLREAQAVFSSDSDEEAIDDLERIGAGLQSAHNRTLSAPSRPKVRVESDEEFDLANGVISDSKQHDDEVEYEPISSTQRSHEHDEIDLSFLDAWAEQGDDDTVSTTSADKAGWAMKRVATQFMAAHGKLLKVLKLIQRSYINIIKAWNSLNRKPAILSDNEIDLVFLNTRDLVVAGNNLYKELKVTQNESRDPGTDESFMERFMSIVVEKAPLLRLFVIYAREYDGAAAALENFRTKFHFEELIELNEHSDNLALADALKLPLQICKKTFRSGDGDGDGDGGWGGWRRGVVCMAN